MSFIEAIRRVGRRRTRATSAASISSSGDSSAVSQSVLTFLSMGLTDGVEGLAANYRPSSKAQEFVTVSGEIINALKSGYENNFADNSVVMSMKVNGQSKRIELIQYERNVMMSLDQSTTLIQRITLAELYANVRNDMIQHPEIYGKDRYLTAIAAPEPR